MEILLKLKEAYSEVLFYVLVVLIVVLSLVALLNIGFILKLVGAIYIIKFLYNNLLFASDREIFLESLTKIIK